MAESARRTVVEKYDWRVIGQTMIARMEAAIPMSGPPEIDMTLTEPFLSGWHAPEHWGDSGDGPGWVRWTDGGAEVMIPSPRQPSTLQLRVQGGNQGQTIRLLVDDVEIVEGRVEKTWQTLDARMEPVAGRDERRLRIESDSWSPSDQGSADTQTAGSGS